MKRRQKKQKTNNRKTESIMPQAESGSNDLRKDASPFNLLFTYANKAVSQGS